MHPLHTPNAWKESFKFQQINMYFFTVHVYLSIFQFECLPAWSIYIKSHFLWHPEGLLKQMLLCRETFIYTDAPHTKTFAHKILASEKPLHRAAFIDRRLYTHTQKAFTQPNLCTHRCFHRMHMKDSTRRNFYTQKCLTQRNSFTEQLLHTRMEAFLHTEAFTH